MQHVHVATHGSHFEYDRLRLTGNALISLIDTLQYGINTKIGSGIQGKDLVQEYRNKVLKSCPGAKLYLDSGGYSIIKGDVPFDKILDFIDEYHDFVSKNIECFDYIFTLDIPIGLKDIKLEREDTIYNLNKISLQKTLALIKKKPELKEKLYFIQHFKMRQQFDIWNQLEEELNINDHIIHRSIGGLVGLKKTITHFKRTTFLPMIFRSFYNFVEQFEKNRQKLFNPDVIFKATDRFFWQLSFAKLFDHVDKITNYVALISSKRAALCEQIINQNELSKTDTSYLNEIYDLFRIVLDDYFRQLEKTPNTDKKELFKFVIEKTFEIEEEKRKEKIDAYASEKNEFRLHVLGVSNLQDRYMIALVERLLNQHCVNAGLKMKLYITYDSIFYTTDALHRGRDIEYYSEEWKRKRLKQVSDDELKEVYQDKFDLVKREITMERLLRADTFSPMNIHSNLLIDEVLMDKMAMSDGFVDKLINALDKNYQDRKVVEELATIFHHEVISLLDLAKDPSEPILNKKHLAERLNDDLITVIKFYLLIKRKDGLTEINQAVEDYVDEFEYPYSLIK
jgi:hypothetical protein